LRLLGLVGTVRSQQLVRELHVLPIGRQYRVRQYRKAVLQQLIQEV
jgi:hypothetical protein